MTRLIAVTVSVILLTGTSPAYGPGWTPATFLPAVAAQGGAKTATPSGSAAAPAAPAPTSALVSAKGSVKFGVIGDTGTGGSEQLAIAKLLAGARARFPYEFVIMLGDNMYGGERAADFVRKFEAPYKPILDAGIKFYATLGNHDEPSQRFYKPFNMDGKRYYTHKKDDVEFFVLDTTQPNTPQFAWLKDALSKSNAKWKISYFHHPLYSSGKKHGSREDMRIILEPLFVEYGVDVVFAGHEHFYERIKPQKGIHYFTAGGSAKLRRGNIDKRSPLTAKGFDTDNTFMLVEIDEDRLMFDTISRKGQIVDSGVIIHRRALTPAEQSAAGHGAGVQHPRTLQGRFDVGQDVLGANVPIQLRLVH